MSSKMTRPWTLADLERLRELAEQGSYPGEIAVEFRRSRDSVVSVALRHGIALRLPADDLGPPAPRRPKGRR
jgi:hypothetical protein